MTSATKTKLKVANRQRILNAALGEFAQKGYDGAGVARIAERAGVSQPNIHYHFKSKRSLWEAAMVHLGEAIEQDRDAQQELYAFLRPLEKLKAACALLIEDAVRRPHLGQIILSEGQIGGERMDWLLRNVLSKFYYEFHELVETCVREGVIKSYRSSQILMLLTGAAVTQFNVSPLVSAVFGSDPRDRRAVDEFKALYIDVLFSGLEPD